MGTRNLTMVIANGETKIAQYGQWDGYPDGQGLIIIDFLSGEGNIDRLKSKLNKVRFIDNESDKDWIDSYNKNAPQWSNEPDKRTPEQKYWWSTYMTRDLAAEILNNVANSKDEEILLGDASDFINNKISCEYAYEINLDKNVLTVYEGGKKMLAAFSITPPPTKEEFLMAFKSEEEE